MKNTDETFIRRCIKLSKESVEKGDAPFGALIVRDGEILVEASNNASGRVSDHAEVLALHAAHEKLKTSDLTGCTLYSNCEPCPMCSFMAREYKISRVVFFLPSPFMGGYSKWNILEDNELIMFQPFFGKVPEVVGGVLEDEARGVFEENSMLMFGSKARENY